mgnify:CR=1 FL=1
MQEAPEPVGLRIYRPNKDRVVTDEVKQEALAKEQGNFPFLFTSVHQIETFVDALKRQRVRDHRVDLNFLVHVPIDDLRHIGAAACAAERSAFPDTAGDQLERARRDLFAGLSNANDNALTPAAMAGLQRLAHHGGVAGRIERVVRAAACEFDQMRDEIAADGLRVDGNASSQTSCPILRDRD